MANNVFTQSFADGNALTAAQLATMGSSIQPDISNMAYATTGSTSGQVFTSNGSNIAPSFQAISDPLGPFALRNYGLKATVASGVMTVSLKTKALTTPSGSDFIDFTYSTNGTTSATYNSVQITAATTLTINASASLGYLSTSTSRIFVYGYYNTVTTSVKLAVSGMCTYDCGAALTTTAISAAADNSSLYATGALTVVPRLLGYIDAAHNSGGSWQTPSHVNVTNYYGGKSVALSASTGSFSTNNTSATSVTNASLTITTSGRPVYLGLIPDGAGTIGNPSYVRAAGLSVNTPGAALFQFMRGTSTTGIFELYNLITPSSGTTRSLIEIPPSSIMHLDVPAAGTYTYTLKVLCETTSPSDVIVINNCKMIAYEL